MGPLSFACVVRPRKSDKIMAEGERTLSIDGNRLTLLPDGPQRLDELLRLINGAKTSLRLLYYIYEPDRAGSRVRRALAAALDRGVDVSLLIDGFGSSNCPDDYFIPLAKKVRASAASTHGMADAICSATTRNSRSPTPNPASRASSSAASTSRMITLAASRRAPGGI